VLKFGRPEFDYLAESKLVFTAWASAGRGHGPLDFHRWYW